MKILDEMDPNSEDLQQLLNDNNYSGRLSSRPRRSSILKLNEATAMAFATDRRSSRRVSWAQTFEYKEVLSDGTAVLTSQELNKYGPIDPNTKVVPIPVNNNEQKNDENRDTNQPLNQNSPRIECQNVDENVQKIKNKFGEKHLPQVLSKYYNPHNDRKDFATVINTALNKYGVEIDTTNPDNNVARLFSLFKRDHPTHEENFTAFLNHFNLNENQQQYSPLKPKKVTDSFEKEVIHTSTINSPINKFFLNSTKISDSNQSFHSFSIKDQSPIRKDDDYMDIQSDSNDDKQSATKSIPKTVHDTTFMRLESSSDDEMSKPMKSAINPIKVDVKNSENYLQDLVFDNSMSTIV
ncbi:hypothetical protein BLA29_003442 [Euroglyphus maynei]|uniref:Uncharacterized protein n=1 Tax=Euroglyphus maynei TaxID=6958 RepID=A0A1Y3BN99_EURMA|nr:hypothetical protein BLA29_003442 [Euroglyphus maynei]